MLRGPLPVLKVTAITSRNRPNSLKFKATEESRASRASEDGRSQTCFKGCGAHVHEWAKAIARQPIPCAENSADRKQ